MHHLQKQSILAIDTESNSLFAYYSRVCLIQLSAPIDAEVDDSTQTDASNRDSTARSPQNVVDFLIDPLRLSTEQVSAVGALIAQKKIEVVMHAAENDIILLQREFGFQFPSVFDTLAARFLGWKQIGLAALLETQFGIISDKRMQRNQLGRTSAFAATDCLCTDGYALSHGFAIHADCATEKCQSLGSGAGCLCATQPDSY